MSDCSDKTSQQLTEVNSLNAKLAYDSAAQLQHQSLVDNQENARRWSAFGYLVAGNIEAFSHATRFNAVVSSQTGATENQQAVTPVRTGAGDYLAAGAVPANRATDVAAAGVATANQAIADALAVAVGLFTQGIAALQAVAVTAAGGASTPSQTQPKPAA